MASHTVTPPRREAVAIATVRSCQPIRKGIGAVITRGVTFEKRPVDPKAYKALDRVVAANEAMRSAEAERSRQAKIRAKAIGEARKWGMSLDAIAERLGVSRERVRQMVLRDR